MQFIFNAFINKSHKNTLNATTYANFVQFIEIRGHECKLFD